MIQLKKSCIFKDFRGVVIGVSSPSCSLVSYEVLGGNKIFLNSFFCFGSIGFGIIEFMHKYGDFWKTFEIWTKLYTCLARAIEANFGPN